MEKMKTTLWNIFWVLLLLWIFFEIAAFIFPNTIGAFKRAIGYGGAELGGAAAALMQFQVNLTQFVKSFIAIVFIVAIVLLIGRFIVRTMRGGN